MADAKILFWDLETTHLKADFATILCAGYKWLGEEEVKVTSITDYKGWKKNPVDDSKLVRDFSQILASADMWVTYYGKGFDVKMMNSKLLEHELPLLPNMPHVDLFYVVKSNLSLSRKSLANVAYYLNLKAEKTPVEGRIWKAAMTGDAAAITYIISHCEADVELLQEAYLKLRPLVRTHPRVNGYGPCRACGSTRLQKRGLALTVLKGPRQRYQCQSCGAWEDRSDSC